MPRPMALLVPAILVVVIPALAAGIASSVAEAATDECISKPNSTAPQGQHWYYRLDRASKRRCWFLGAEGRTVRSDAPSKRAKVRPVASPKVMPSVKPDVPARVDPKPAAQVAAATPPEARIEEQPIRVRETESGFARRWSDLPAAATTPALAPAVEAELAQARVRGSSPRSSEYTDARARRGRGRESADPGYQLRTSYAEERPPTYSEDDMPLVWPVLSSADLEPATRSNVTHVLLVLIGGALCIVAVFGCVIFKLSVARPASGRQGPKRWASAAPICRRQRIPPTCGQVIAARSHAERVDELVAAMRRAGRAQRVAA